MFNIGPSEMMLLAMLALLLFGPRRLPEIGKALGEGIAAFRNASKTITDEMQRQLEAESAAAKNPPQQDPSRALPTPPPTESVPMGEWTDSAATPDEANQTTEIETVGEEPTTTTVLPEPTVAAEEATVAGESLEVSRS